MPIAGQVSKAVPGKVVSQAFEKLIPGRPPTLKMWRKDKITASVFPELQ